MVTPLMILSLDQGKIYEAPRPRDEPDERAIAEVNAYRSADPIADMGLVHFLDRLVARSHFLLSPPHMYSPPLTWMTWPVMYPAPSEARNRTTAATSLAVTRTDARVGSAGPRNRPRRSSPRTSQIHGPG